MTKTNDFTDDSRLTAYALGELTGDDLREIEALLASNADARRVVDEIRATASLVTAELGAAGGESTISLTAEQRARIAARADVAKPVVPMRRVYWTAAASLIVGATAGAATSTMWMAPRGEAKAIARADDGVVHKAQRETERKADEALLKELRNSNTALDDANKQSRAELDKLSNAQLDAQTKGGEWNPVEKGTLRGGVPAEYPPVDVISEKPPPTPVAKKPASPAQPAAPAPELKVGAKLNIPAPAGRVARDDEKQAAKSRLSTGAGARNPVEPAKPARPVTFDDPAPPPDAGGPSTPGGGGGAGGPATGGPDSETKKKFADYHKVTPEELKVQEELFRNEVQFPKADNLLERTSSTASYSHIEDNPFRLVKDAPLSTFGADVDTASYSNVRRFLNSGQLPPPGAVRIEEMVNYFPYDYAPPTDGRPFAVRVDVAGCPWKTDHRLVRIGIKGKIVDSSARPAANLVFLLDVSGSMAPAERLPLVKQSMKLLVEKLEAKDRVAIVVYAGESGLALPSTSCEDKGKILAALDSLHAGGSTNGASGIQLAYQVATQNRIDGGVNRVILATDGDFNVGVSDDSSLVKLIEEERKTGVFLSVLGVGTDNLKDAKMEQLADHGNGAYAYVDTLKEGQKVLVEQAAGTLYTIAKDVKLQVEFNPAQVGSWRLIGYEDRVLAAEDFKDDKKDAGDIGAGHTVTALYELVPPGVLTQTAGVEPLKYQRPPEPTGPLSNELLTVKLRWKEPNSDVSTPMEVPVIDEGLSYSAASPDFKFAASVAAFGMCLRNSPNKGQANLDAVLELATEGAANDPGGYRKEFVGLVQRAKQLGAK